MNLVNLTQIVPGLYFVLGMSTLPTKKLVTIPKPCTLVVFEEEEIIFAHVEDSIEA